MWDNVLMLNPLNLADPDEEPYYQSFFSDGRAGRAGW
jgi:hypothetical protein